MRIQCPNCQAGLEIGQPKAGRYRPRCKQCGEPFLLAVSDDQPPKIRVAREKMATATLDSAPSGKTRSASFEATLAPDDNLAQTMDTGASCSSGVVVVSKSKTLSDSKTQTTDSSGRSAAATQVKSGEDGEMPARLGGYRLIRVLGRGAMGAVYEAKQISLDRTVALKTIRDRLMNKPSALARFTREAYAAAQLNHHNVVQIYDFGEDAGQHYFSMERVDGAALSEVVQERGPLEAKLAATYIAQAARGLQFAHRSGMVHRDVKPANLLLSRDGVVKVADLGLVKIPDQQEVDADGDEESMFSRASGTQVTMLGTTVGTPAYMAPEQSTDATQVDHRADIYSLGCTLFYLLAGKPPFDAPDVSTLLAQHAKAPIPNLRATHPQIPPQLDKIIQTAMAKRAEDRYATLAEMLSDLEEFLGAKSGSAFWSNVASADAWSEMAAQFARVAPQARLRSIAVLGFVAFCALLLLLTPWIGLGWILLSPFCLLSGVVISAVLESTHGESAISGAGRRWLSSLSLIDWAYVISVIVLVLGMALFAGCWPGLIVGSLLGAALASGYHFGLRRPILSSRKPVLESAEKMVREFRISGADEDGLRAFVAKYSGRSWSELFEALFGFDALTVMRDQARRDPAMAVPGLTLRDRLVMKLNDRAKVNRDARDQQKLSKIEQRALVSEGVSEADARDRGWQMAAALMDATKLPPAEETAAVAAEAKRRRMKAMMADARSGRYAKTRDRFGFLKLLLGAQLRFALGVGLLAIVAMWAKQSGILNSESIQSVASQIQQGDVNLGEMSENLRERVQAAEASGPLSEATIFGIRVMSLAIAGLLLIASAFVSGWRMTPFALLAAAAAMLGPAMGVPSIGPLPAPILAAAVALIILVFGLLLRERVPSAT